MNDVLLTLTLWCLEHPGHDFAFRFIPKGLARFDFMLGIAPPALPGTDPSQRKAVSCKATVSLAELALSQNKVAAIASIWMGLAREVINRVENDKPGTIIT